MIKRDQIIADISLAVDMILVFNKGNVICVIIGFFIWCNVCLNGDRDSVFCRLER